MKATLIFHDKRRDPADGSIVEMTIWEVPVAVPGSSHRFRYSLFFGFPGRRIVGCDNEPGKGDQRHYEDHEEVHEFTSVEALIRDFIADVRRLRGAK